MLSYALTPCGLYLHINRVVLMVIYKRNSPILLLNAIDHHARFAVPGADL